MTTTATTITTSTATVALSTMDATTCSENQSAYSFVTSPPTLQLITNLPPPEDLPTPTTTKERMPRHKTLVVTCVDILCHLLLYLVHAIYLIYIGLRTLRSLGYSRMLQYTDVDERMQAIRRDKSQLTKIPKHLSILISRELEDRDLQDWETIVDELCLTSCWAWAFGIEELSVFDGSGTLKEMAIDVYKRQSTVMHQWMKSASSPDDARPGLKFTILSTLDGRARLAKTTRDIAKHVISEGKTVDIALVDQFVHESSTSDPDLMLAYSGLPHNYISLDGFPPWHIRLTEFLNVNEFHRLDYALFSQCLYKYSRVEQRFGR